jgi:hypothetical protein
MRSYIAEEIHWIAPASVMFQELHRIGVGLCRYRAREREVELWHLWVRMIEVGADRFRIPDIMFNPSLLQVLTVMGVLCMIKMLLTFVSCRPEGFMLLFLGSTTV